MESTQILTKRRWNKRVVNDCDKLVACRSSLRMKTTTKIYYLMIGSMVFLVFCCNLCQASRFGLEKNNQQDDSDITTSTTAVSKYREPSSWLINSLMGFFEDIDWQAIAVAREQVEKFVRSVDRVLTAFRLSNKSSTGKDPEDLARIFSSSWWQGKGKATTVDAADSTNVKAMLERIACFVGYMRLLNHSNEALAELDASKVVSNLFNSSKKNSSWSWFG